MKLNSLIHEVFKKSVDKELSVFFKNNPQNASWYLISDYCIGNRVNQNDSITFSLLLNHDTSANIKDFIKTNIPRDLKKTRKANRSIISYLNLPIIFHFSLVISTKQKLLSKALNLSVLTSYFKDLKSIVDRSSKLNNFEYFTDVSNRIEIVLKELTKKGCNFKLIRNITIVSAFAGSIIDLMQRNGSPSHVAWVPDRDPILDKFETVVFDLINYATKSIFLKANILKNDPQLIYSEPDKIGVNFYDELVRLPDYITGTLATFNFEGESDLKLKHQQVLHDSIIASKNHLVMQLEYSEEEDTLRSRRIILN